MIRCSHVVSIGDTSAVAEARRAALECAGALRLSETAAGKAALVATELATNVLKHANGGSLLLASDTESPGSVVLVAVDHGGGIHNVQKAMEDGFSTAGSPGTGLGAIARSASSFDIYSTAGKGTVAACRIDDPQYVPGTKPRLAIAGISVPKSGETEVGDGWTSIQTNQGATIFVVDGLGHGPMAAVAANAAIRVVEERPDIELDHMVRDLHGALRPTRGAAVGIARIRASVVDFVGVGNIFGTIAADVTRRTVSHGGIVGHEVRKIQPFSYPWTPGSLLVLQSDGMHTNWSFDTYPGLTERDPIVIAAVLFRDHCRGNDDATVVVAKPS